MFQQEILNLTTWQLLLHINLLCTFYNEWGIFGFSKKKFVSEVYRALAAKNYFWHIKEIIELIEIKFHFFWGQLQLVSVFLFFFVSFFQIQISCTVVSVRNQSNSNTSCVSQKWSIGFETNSLFIIQMKVRLKKTIVPAILIFEFQRMIQLRKNKIFILS